MLGKQELHKIAMYAIISEWRSSGLTKRAYCLEKGIRWTRLKYWIIRQNKDPLFKGNIEDKPSAFLPIELIGTRTTSEQRLSTEDFPVKLHYPNGVVLEVSSLLPNQDLMELIKNY